MRRSVQKKSNPVKFLLSIAPGPKREPDVNSEEYLRSLILAGAWLRVLPARMALDAIRSSSSSPLEKAAAQVQFYQNIGAQVEDLGVFLVAASAWVMNDSESLADLVSRVFLKPDSRDTKTDEEYSAHVARILGSKGRRLSVDPQRFFREAGEKSDRDIVKFFLGFEWNSVPSAKTVLQTDRDAWLVLPKALRDICNGFSAPEGPLLGAAYNKLKHGPQMVLKNAVVAAEDRGHSGKELGELKRWLGDGQHVRLLFRGARVQDEQGELEEGTRTAPFIIGSSRELEKMFYETMVHQGNIMSLMGHFLLRVHTQSKVTVPMDPIVEKIQAEHSSWLTHASDSGRVVLF